MLNNVIHYGIPEEHIPFLDVEKKELHLDQVIPEMVMSVNYPLPGDVAPVRLLTTLSIRIEDGSEYPLIITLKGKEPKINIEYPLTINQHKEFTTAEVLGKNTFKFETEDETTINNILDEGDWVSHLLKEFNLEEGDGNYEIQKWAYSEGSSIVIARSFVITNINSLKPYIALRTDIFKKDVISCKLFEDINMEAIPHDDLFPILKELDLLGESI